MAWRGESWADIVARAATTTPHARRSALESEDRAALAARAQPWAFPVARLETTEHGLILGAQLESVEVAFAQLYHVEPVDPWPSIAVGWVDRGEAYSTVLTPREPEQDPFAFAAIVEEIMTTHAARLSAAAPGWLAVPVIAWERVDALPGERDEGPAMRGYRMAPEVADPVVARRTTAPGAGSLWTWIWARLLPPPRRIDAREIVLTQRFVYVRTRVGERLRSPASALRASRRTPQGDAIYVFGRNTELLVVHQEGCPLAAALDARLGGSAHDHG